MIDKTRGDLEEFVSTIRPGSTLAIGGFGMAGVPFRLIDAVLASGADHLHVVSNNAGMAGTGIAKLIAAQRITELTCSYPLNPEVYTQYEHGGLILHIVPQGTLAERLRAAGAGIPAFYTATAAGTQLANGEIPTRLGKEPLRSLAREARTIDGREYVLESALPVDLALVHASVADRHGNARFRRGSRNFNPLAAMAAARTIVEADTVLAHESLDPDDVHLPGPFVDEVVTATPPPALPSDDFSAGRGEDDAGLGWSRAAIAARVAADLEDGWAVNLGIGIPLLVPSHVPPEVEVMLHSEQGLLGIGGPASPEQRDRDVTDAGKGFVTLVEGASAFDSAQSFALVRSGRLDVTVLGALQVSRNGDLANWLVPKGRPGVGGAMDLAANAKRVWAVMEQVDRSGAPKLVDECSYPVTALACVDRLFTNLGVYDRTEQGLRLTELAGGVTIADVRAASGFDPAW